jgi:predicted O-methyltransferase YrrM
MTQELWTAVTEYLDELFPPDPALSLALESSADAGLPAIAVSHDDGRMLQLLARLQKACLILEIGTLGGYSAIWLARALPEGGRLITLELEPKHAEVARRNLERAGLSDRVEVLIGPALESLPALVRRYPEGFDLIFIDADKTGYPDYWKWAMKLSHPGTLIVADNVVRSGAVADPNSADPDVQAVRAYLALVAAEPRVQATVIQTVGAKGYDGMSLALVK